MLDPLKQEAYEANMLLPAYGLIHLTWGNASAVDRDRGLLAIKPSGVEYSALRVEDMVLVDLDGRQVAAGLKPSADTPTHVCLYRAFPQVGGIVHTHSRFATSFAQAGRAIPCLGTTHADYFQGDIPLTRELSDAEVEGDYEWHTGQVIAECFADLQALACPGVLVHGHGPFAWGKDAAAAAQTASVMEMLAEMALYSLSLNPTLPGLGTHLRDRHFQRKHGAQAYYGQ